MTTAPRHPADLLNACLAWLASRGCAGALGRFHARLTVAWVRLDREQPFAAAFAGDWDEDETHDYWSLADLAAAAGWRLDKRTLGLVVFVAAPARKPWRGVQGGDDDEIPF